MSQLPIRPKGSGGIGGGEVTEEPEWKKQMEMNAGFRDASLYRAARYLREAIEHQELVVYLRFTEKPLPKWQESVRRWPSGAHMAKADDLLLCNLQSVYDLLGGDAAADAAA